MGALGALSVWVGCTGGVEWGGVGCAPTTHPLPTHHYPPPARNHWSPTTNHRTTYHQTPAANHQLPTNNNHPPQTHHTPHTPRPRPHTTHHTPSIIHTPLTTNYQPPTHQTPPTYSSPLTFPIPPLTPGDLSSLKGMLALTELSLNGCSLITGTVAVWAHGRVDGGS